MFDLQSTIDILSKQHDLDAINGGALTLGALRTALSVVPKETIILINGIGNNVLRSYRGYYDRLAFDKENVAFEQTEIIGGGESFDDEYLGSYVTGVSHLEIKSPLNAGNYIEALNLADGTKFEGYKGGQYLMSANTILHLAPYGDCGLTLTTDIETRKQGVLNIKAVQEEF